MQAFQRISIERQAIETQLKHSDRSISLNSASGYYSTFRGLLKIAYRDKWIRENINDFLDKIEPEDVKKEYLTLDEVKLLAATPCDIPVLKAASLFACLTGLRISDILKLQWEDFEIAPDQGYCLRIRTQKTQTEATPRLLPAHPYTKDANGSDTSYQQRGIRIVWNTRHRKSIQGIATEHDATSIKEMD